MKFLKILFIILFAATAFSSDIFPQIQRGTHTARRVGVMRGNQVRTVFTNYGAIGQPGSQGPMVAWKYDNNGYVGDISPIVGVRLPIKDYLVNGFKDGKPDTLFQVITCPIDRPGGANKSPDGSTDWTFEPIPGFFNPNLRELGKGVAISNQPETWPKYWPDHPDWLDKNGNVQWDGYFGRGELNADQETYFMMDDQADEKMYMLHGFLPDSTDPSRKGQALQVSARALQWANFRAQDVIFWLYDVKNVGTSIYDQTAFGLVVGTYVGGAGDEWNDDASYFDIRQSMTYSWDFDHYIRPTANPKWMPNPSAVGYLGYAFLESPGNPYDGIDNDGDNSSYTVDAPYYTASDFDPHTVKAGDKLVVIDKYTYKRKVFTMPAHDTSVVSMGVTFNLVPDSTVLSEGDLKPGTSTVNPNAYDGIDNNLNGIIDENYQLDYRLFKQTSKGLVLIDSLNPIQHKDFIHGKGLTDPMIDEARDDGIDNDRSWDLTYDDIGIDGVMDTYDFGEGDGKPTSGWQKPGVLPTDPANKQNIFGLVDSDEPGEPNIDKTDVHESDQIGMTSFYYFVPSSDIDMSNQNDMWRRLQPGRFDVPEAVVNNRTIRGEDGDFIFGSGYFPLLPGETERFSLALVFGDDFSGVFRNKKIAQIIYDANYNFPKPPDKPTLTAVPGDHKVTLYWDKIAEKTFDKVLQKRDFEGYKIYKSTDPDFSDIKTISDGYGQLVDYKPLAQFDVADGITGFFYSDPLLYQLSSGKPFYFGEDTGIKNSYVDYDVINGKTYYYAVCAYNTGDAARSIYPSENTKLVSLDASGKVSLDINTAMVTPNAPIAGYVPPASGVPLSRVAGASTLTPGVQVIDPTKVKTTTYFVTFNDSLVQGIPIAYSYNVVDSTSGDTLLANDKAMLNTNGDVFDGMSLSINTAYQVLDSLRLDTTKSGWNNQYSNNLKYTISQFHYGDISGIRYPYDYLFVFHNNFSDTSSTLTGIFGSSSKLQAKPTNFSVYDVTDRSHPVKIQYAFIDRPGALQDTLSNFDVVYLSNSNGTKLAWGITFQGDSARIPAESDSLLLTFQKPFSSGDKFIYRSTGTGFNADAAGKQMNMIRAVPNPYVVSNMFERPLPAQERGRGERVIDFINLPPNSKISIYTSSGELVRTIYHDGNYQTGSATWDLRSKEGLDVAFGVYFYVVEAPGIKEKKFGKLAIIK